MDYLESLGILGLFIGSFLAATIIPFSAEALFVALLFANVGQPYVLILVASLGNTLGGLSTYALGWYGNWERIKRFTGITSEKAKKWEGTLKKKGAYFALFTWAPVIGDVIALVLGLLKANFTLVATLMLIGKTLRFIVIYQLKLAF